jgi:hypothetical protein
LILDLGSLAVLIPRKIPIPHRRLDDSNQQKSHLTGIQIGKISPAHSHSDLENQVENQDLIFYSPTLLIGLAPFYIQGRDMVLPVAALSEGLKCQPEASRSTKQIPTTITSNHASLHRTLRNRSRHSRAVEVYNISCEDTQQHQISTFASLLRMGESR